MIQSQIIPLMCQSLPCNLKNPWFRNKTQISMFSGLKLKVGPQPRFRDLRFACPIIPVTNNFQSYYLTPHLIYPSKWQRLRCPNASGHVPPLRRPGCHYCLCPWLWKNCDHRWRASFKPSSGWGAGNEMGEEMTEKMVEAKFANLHYIEYLQDYASSLSGHGKPEFIWLSFPPFHFLHL